MHIRVSSNQIWTTKVHLPRSTVEASFWSPLAILPLAVRGGSGIKRATLERSGFIRLDQRNSGRIPDPPCHSAFNGGGGLEWHGM
jgi:hypothetical protein